MWRSVEHLKLVHFKVILCGYFVFILLQELWLENVIRHQSMQNKSERKLFTTTFSKQKKTQDETTVAVFYNIKKSNSGQATSRWDCKLDRHWQGEIHAQWTCCTLRVRDFPPPPPLVVMIWDQDSVTAVRDDSLASKIFRVFLKDYRAAPSCVRHTINPASPRLLFFFLLLLFFLPSAGRDWKTSSRRSPGGSNEEVWRPCQLTVHSLELYWPHSGGQLLCSCVFPQSYSLTQSTACPGG